MHIKKLLEEAREGYYFILRKSVNHNMASMQVKDVYKYLFIGYYMSIIVVVLSLLIFINGAPLTQIGKKNMLLNFSVGVLLIYLYKILVADPLMKDFQDKEIDSEQEEIEKKRKKRLFYYLFIGSFLSMGLSGIIADILT